MCPVLFPPSRNLHNRSTEHVIVIRQLHLRSLQICKHTSAPEGQARRWMLSPPAISESHARQGGGLWGGGGVTTTAAVSISRPQAELRTSDTGASHSSAPLTTYCKWGAHTFSETDALNVWVSVENRLLERREWGGGLRLQRKGTGVNPSSMMSHPKVGEIIHNSLIKMPSSHIWEIEWVQSLAENEHIEKVSERSRSSFTVCWETTGISWCRPSPAVWLSWQP